MRESLLRLRNWLRPSPPKDPSRATVADIHSCYRLLLGREPDEPGLAHWQEMVTKHKIPLHILVDGFLNSYEFQALQEERNRPRLVELQGFRMFVRTNDFLLGWRVAREKQYEAHVTEELRRLLEPGNTFIDIGANIGYFSLLAALLVGLQGKVIAFEPDADNCDLFRRSIRENGFINIDLRTKAVAESEGWLYLSGSPTDSNARIVSESEAEAQPYPLDKVEAVRLDEALAAVDRIDVIKMDIEGAEPRAFSGMGMIIKKHRPTIVTEFSPTLIKMTSGTSPESFLDSLSQHYELFILDRATGLSPTPLGSEAIMGIYGESGLPHLILVAIPS